VLDKLEIANEKGSVPNPTIKIVDCGQITVWINKIIIITFIFYWFIILYQKFYLIIHLLINHYYN
jgi:hypothetical protein